ncbi:MAG: hypothetical protein VKP72_03395 [bacterium]|nr:hypothetical protein [bacterium]
MGRGWVAWGLMLTACGGTAIASVGPRPVEILLQAGPCQLRALTCYPGRGWVVETRHMTLPSGRVRVLVGDTLSRVEAAQAWLDVPARLIEVRRLGDATDRVGWLTTFQGRTVELQPPLASSSLSGTLWLLDGAPVLRVGDRLVPARLEDLRLPASASDLPAPGLAVDLEVPKPWQGLATLSYPVGGLGWQARHRVHTDGRLTRGDWTAIATVQNTTGWPVRADVLGLWSGDPAPRPWFAAPARGLAAETVAVPQPVGHRVRLDLPGGLDLGPGREVHRHLGTWSGIPLVTRADAHCPVDMQAPTEPVSLRARMAVIPPGPSPWSAGPVHVLTPDASGQPVGIAEGWIPDTPAGQERWIELGEAPELTCRAVLEVHRIGAGRETRAWSYRVVNRASRSWEVVVRVDLTSGAWSRSAADPGFLTVSANLHEWRGTVEPGARTEVRATWQRPWPVTGRGND